MSTKDTIQESMNLRLTSQATKLEGGTTQDILGSVAYELANIIDTRIDTILDNAFVTTADSEHLKIRGEELGIFQKAAVFAFVYARVEGASPNAFFEAGFKAHTDTGVIFQSIEDATADENGVFVVKMQCLEVGSIGNIAAGTLVNFYDDYQGLTGAEITNEASGYDGYPAETTEEYRARILEYIKDNASNSNIADYQKWTKSVNGVNRVIVKDAFTSGAGRVTVYISAKDGEFVSNELLEAVNAVIKKEQIINADVTVLPLENSEISISADVVLEAGKNIQEIKEEFGSLVKEYFENISESVSYLYISNLLFGIEGVIDVSSYLLNNDTKSVQLNALEVPVLSELELNEI